MSERPRLVGPACRVGPVGGHSNRDWCRTHRAYVDSFGVLGLAHAYSGETHHDVRRAVELAARWSRP